MTQSDLASQSSLLRNARVFLIIALVVGILTSLGWVLLTLLYLDFPDATYASLVLIFGGQGAKYVGYFMAVSAIVSFISLRHVNLLRKALNGGEEGASRLHELNSLGWAIVTLVLANPVGGLMLLLARSPIRRLYPIGAENLAPNQVLAVEHLTKFFPVKRTLAQLMRGAGDVKVHAVDDVSFEVLRGQVYGLAGESGSGKTTVLRTALKLTPPTSGRIRFSGKDLSKLTKKEMKQVRTKLQVVFQDPYESVNPRMPVFDIVSEGLYINKLVSSKEEARLKVQKALSDVQLSPPEEFMDRFPHELSGGQRQRVAIARALVLEPDLILADEPVSMLDVSVRAEVINVLLAIREKRGISVLMVTHDLALSKDVVDELAIMYLGKIVETGPAEGVVSIPYHPYTQALVAAVPVPDPVASKVKVLAKGEIPTNISPPSGCRFHPRCPLAQEICTTTEPPLDEVAPGRKVACHFWKEARDSFLAGAPKVESV